MPEASVAPLAMNAPHHQPEVADDSLKIIVVGTPKTGNTWLTHLLAEVYDLPQVSLSADYQAIDWNALGPRWVGQQHYQPEAQLKHIAQSLGVVFVTPIRHPADVFVSLRHYTDRREARDEDEVNVRTRRPDYMLEDGPGNFGEATSHYLQHGFYLKLHLSIYWLRMGWSFGVRYEDLWLQPVATMATLCDQILEVDSDKIRRAVCSCEIGVMRQVLDPAGGFVRRGGINGWKQALPSHLHEILSGQAPYPQQFATLGYSMNPDDPANETVTEPSREDSPFAGGRFANGVPVAPILVHFYFEGIKKDPQKWTDASGTGPGSYYAWLNSPASADPSQGGDVPTITELAYAFYQMRQDLPTVFPDPFGEDRRVFADWFLHSAIREFEFDDAFVLPVIESWARGPAA